MELKGIRFEVIQTFRRFNIKYKQEIFNRIKSPLRKESEGSFKDHYLINLSIANVSFLSDFIRST